MEEIFKQSFTGLNSEFSLPYQLDCSICWLHLCKEVRPHSSMRLPVGCGWWPVRLQDRILVTEQSVTQQPKWSHVCNISTLSLTGLDKWSERSDLINWVVMLSLSIYIDCPDQILQIALEANKYPTLFYLKGAWRQ